MSENSAEPITPLGNSMATRSGTLARIRGAGGGASNRGGSELARRPPERRCATPCASGGWGCRRGGRPASYWEHGAPTPRPTAKRPLSGRLVGVHRSFPGCEGARQRFRQVAEPFADTFLLGDVTVTYDHVQSRLARWPPHALLRGGASHEAEGRCGARGGGAGRVRAPAGRLRLLRQILDELVPGVEEFLLATAMKTAMATAGWPRKRRGLIAGLLG